MVKDMKSYDKLFITGCDKKTDWMLDWFLRKFRKHNPGGRAEILVCDFGMSEIAHDEFAIISDGILDMTKHKAKGWFKKPAAMQEASKIANYVCWIDTDCEVRGNLLPIFDNVEPNKLAMVEDVPWSKRRGEKWHNSGVVAFKDRPIILDEWVAAVEQFPRDGDQEVLHQLLRPGIRRLLHITDLPRKYNTLRLDLQDNTAPDNPVVMHWTGAKGKQHILKEVQK